MCLGLFSSYPCSRSRAPPGRPKTGETDSVCIASEIYRAAGGGRRCPGGAWKVNVKHVCHFGRLVQGTSKFTTLNFDKHFPQGNTARSKIDLYVLNYLVLLSIALYKV